MPWTFFANGLSESSNSLVGSSNLIKKVYFPRIIIPTSAVAAGLVELGIGFLLLIVLMFYYGVGLHLSLLLLPLLIALVTLLALGVGIWFSALNVKAV